MRKTVVVAVILCLVATLAFADGATKGSPPIVLSSGPFLTFYQFAGAYYYYDGTAGTGFMPLVTAVVTMQPTDTKLQQLASDYQKKVTTGETLVWTGLIGGLAGSIYGSVFAGMLGNESTWSEFNNDMTQAIVGVGVGIAGLVVYWIGTLVPGQPTEFVNYYNGQYATGN